MDEKDSNTNDEVGSTSANIASRDDNDSLSSHEGEDTVDDLKGNASIDSLCFVGGLSLAESTFWEADSELSKAIRQLAQDNGHHATLHSPSAAQAEVAAQTFYQQIHELIQEKGTTSQKAIWDEAAVEHRQELIASFFLPPGVVAAGVKGSDS